MEKEFRVIIAGTRHFNDYNRLKEKCNNLLRGVSRAHTIIIRSGKAKGADTLGEKFANEHGYLIEEFPADWANLGRKAGPIRNKEMAEGNETFPQKANMLIAFWDGKSVGTKIMIDIAKRQGLIVRVFDYKNSKISF